MHQEATIEQANNAAWLIKICPGKQSVQYKKKATERVLKDNSIGIHYGIIRPLHGENETEIRRELRANYIANGYSDEDDAANPVSKILDPKKRFTYLVNDFVNSVGIGDKVLLGIGQYGDKNDIYLARITGHQYFTNEDQWSFSGRNDVQPEHENHKVGYFLRRKIEIIGKLPSRAKWKLGCTDTIKKRPSNGWEIYIDQ